MIFIMNKYLTSALIILFFTTSCHVLDSKSECNCPEIPKQEEKPPKNDGVYGWKVKRIVDGDTLEVSETFVPSELKLLVRVNGVDTPEKSWRAKCPEEKALAEKASAFTSEIIKNAQDNNTPIRFSKLKWDKYGGRVLAIVMIGDRNLATELINKGYAREYHGKKKESWCNIQ